MTANHSSGNADPDLIRYIDGEMDADERSRIEALIAVDSAVAARFAVLERRSRRLGTLLTAADPSTAETDAARPVAAAADRIVPITAARSARVVRISRGIHHGWLRAAAVILVLLAGAMAVAPVRAWIVDTLQRWAGSDAVAPAPDPAVEPEPAQDAFGFRFDLSGSTVAIEIDHAQAGGTLTVRQADVARAGAEIRTGGASESFLLLPDGLRITNASTSTASYEIVVPTAITRATVRIGGAAAIVYGLDDASGHTVELKSSARN